MASLEKMNELTKRFRLSWDGRAAPEDDGRNPEEKRLDDLRRRFHIDGPLAPIAAAAADDDPVGRYRRLLGMPEMIGEDPVIAETRRFRAVMVRMGTPITWDEALQTTLERLQGQGDGNDGSK